MRQLREFSDRELLDSCSGGQNKCMDELVNRYASRVKAYIRQNVHNKADVDDIFQEAFIRVFLSIKSGKYSDDGRFASWVIRIAHNLIVDNYRRRKVQKTMLDADCDHTVVETYEERETQASIESEIVRSQELAEVGSLVKHLPQTQRVVIELKHYSGLSFREIAEETDVSINTALGRMRYGIINLRRMMNERRLCV